MPTLVISIDLPPTGELETSPNWSGAATDAQMAEETQARQNFLGLVSPYFESLLKRPARRQGNVGGVELLGCDQWSQFNHYLLLVTFDIGEPVSVSDLSALLPQGSQVSVVGASFAPVEWPAAGQPTVPGAGGGS
jgi:hypothetical protein